VRLILENNVVISGLLMRSASLSRLAERQPMINRRSRRSRIAGRKYLL